MTNVEHGLEIHWRQTKSCSHRLLRSWNILAHASEMLIQMLKASECLGKIIPTCS